jgi:hypothetical protein
MESMFQKKAAIGSTGLRVKGALTVVSSNSFYYFRVKTSRWPLSRAGNYAPNKFAKHTKADGVTKADFIAAMQRLLDAGHIRIEEIGPPSRRTSRLVIGPVK